MRKLLAIIIWILTTPINVALLLIPEFIYWILTNKKSLMQDGDALIRKLKSNKSLTI